MMIGSGTDAKNPLTRSLSSKEHIKLRDVYHNSQYYREEGQFDVYHIRRFVIEGVAYGDRRITVDGYPGTIVCMVKRRSDDFDKSSIYVGIKLVSVKIIQLEIQNMCGRNVRMEHEKDAIMPNSA